MYKAHFYHRFALMYPFNMNVHGQTSCRKKEAILHGLSGFAQDAGDHLVATFSQLSILFLFSRLTCLKCFYSLAAESKFAEITYHSSTLTDLFQSLIFAIIQGVILAEESSHIQVAIIKLLNVQSSVNLCTHNVFSQLEYFILSTNFTVNQSMFTLSLSSIFHAAFQNNLLPSKPSIRGSPRKLPASPTTPSRESPRRSTSSSDSHHSGPTLRVSPAPNKIVPRSSSSIGASTPNLNKWSSGNYERTNGHLSPTRQGFQGLGMGGGRRELSSLEGLDEEILYFLSAFSDMQHPIQAFKDISYMLRNVQRQQGSSAGTILKQLPLSD